jgi:predicted O-methyltransferase YrrM
MRLKKRDITKAIAAFFVFLALSLLWIPFLGEYTPFAALALLLAIVWLLVMDNARGAQELIRKLSQQQMSHYRQTEALFSLFSSLRPSHPLPPMRGWTISPDAANALVTLIDIERPRVIVEAGSGVSTVLCAYALRAIGEGRIVSLDHEAEYAARTREMLKRHELQEFATVHHAPLKPVTLGNESLSWYDQAPLETIQSIDLLIVDGPPTKRDPLARYPALPLLLDRLSPSALIFLDDCDRPADRATIERWLREFDGFREECLNSEKGTIVLRRSRNGAVS